MKILVTLLVLAFATPVYAQGQISKQSEPRKDKSKILLDKRVGPQGLCLQHADGYCRSTQEFWQAMMDRN
jgi:hypothetical protein